MSANVINWIKRLWRAAFPRKPYMSMHVDVGIPKILRFSIGERFGQDNGCIAWIDYSTGKFRVDYY